MKEKSNKWESCSWQVYIEKTCEKLTYGRKKLFSKIDIPFQIWMFSEKVLNTKKSLKNVLRLIGGVMGDLNLSNGFMFGPVLDSSCFALTKHDFRVSKHCVFQLVSIDSETAPLDSYS